MEFDFHRIEKWNFSILDEYYQTSGIYVFEFPNGMKYLGKTKKINRRAREHFYDFLNGNDWHHEAIKSFTKLIPIPNYGFYDFIAKVHPQWKRMTAKRKQIAQVEYEYYYEKYRQNYYEIACDLFQNVKLDVWLVPEDSITEAEAFCLKQIALKGKKEQYYNRVYPRVEFE